MLFKRDLYKTDAKITDARIENHGTIVLVRPLSDTAREWLGDHTDGMWFGGALAVEPRYVGALAEVMLDAGLAFEEESA